MHANTCACGCVRTCACTYMYHRHHYHHHSSTSIFHACTAQKYTHAHTSAQVQAHTHTHTCRPTQTHAYMHIWMHMYKHTYKHTHRHTHTHTWAHTRTNDDCLDTTDRLSHRLSQISCHTHTQEYVVRSELWNFRLVCRTVQWSVTIHATHAQVIGELAGRRSIEQRHSVDIRLTRSIVRAGRPIQGITFL